MRGEDLPHKTVLQVHIHDVLPRIIHDITGLATNHERCFDVAVVILVQTVRDAGQHTATSTQRLWAWTLWKRCSVSALKTSS